MTMVRRINSNKPTQYKCNFQDIYPKKINIDFFQNIFKLPRITKNAPGEARHWQEQNVQDIDHLQRVDLKTPILWAKKETINQHKPKKKQVGK